VDGAGRRPVSVVPTGAEERAMLMYNFFRKIAANAA
jgi:hypothetical protein